jgi:hypothetical protein
MTSRGSSAGCAAKAQAQWRASTRSRARRAPTRTPWSCGREGGLRRTQGWREQKLDVEGMDLGGGHAEGIDSERMWRMRHADGPCVARGWSRWGGLCERGD